jgi:arsenate reductase-like glutaredoxin family protein
LSAAELDELLALAGPEDLFAWQSPRARKLGLVKGEVANDRLVNLMRTEPYLIRRPLVRRGDQLIIGANGKKLDDVFGT